MSLHLLKPRFQAVLRPVVRQIHASGVRANQVTVFTCAASIAVGGWLVVAARSGQFDSFLLLPVWFALRMALNAIDGLLAREFAQQSALGAYFNELSDPLSDAALYLPFVFLPGEAGAAVLVVIFLAVVSEMAGLLGQLSCGQRRNDGPMGKSDRALVFGALGLLVGLGISPGPWLTWVAAGVALLLGLTIVNRVRRGVAASDRPLDLGGQRQEDRRAPR